MPVAESPAGLSPPYVRIWFRLVTELLEKGLPLYEAIRRVNHDIGVHDGIHDSLDREP